MPATRQSRRPAVLLEALESRTLMSLTTYGFSTAFSFNNISANQGVSPNTLVRDAAGNVFGTTASGGAGSYGTIFEIPAATGKLTILAQFNSFNGFNPVGPVVVDSHGNLFGAAADGGIYNRGTLYELAAGTHTIVPLAYFSVATGSHPFGGVTADAAGNLYGTTFDGGPNKLGSVFKYTRSTGTLTILKTFTNGTGGQNTSTPVVDPAGNIFGTTFTGGAAGRGTVFEILAGSNAFITLASFGGAIGANPTGALLRDSAGSLYGICSNGGSNSDGTVWVMPAGTHNILRLGTFAGGNGMHPVGGLVADAIGDLFGTTAAGGPNSGGTAYVVPARSGIVFNLASFPSQAVGLHPSGGLIMTASGSLLGTTFSGGTFNDGTIFELTPTAPTALGFIDSASATTVQGWAYAPAQGATSIHVALYIDGHFVANVAANLSRPDLAGASVNGTPIIGTLHGFSIDYSSLGLIEIGGIHTVQVYAIASANGVVNPLIGTKTVAMPV